MSTPILVTGGTGTLGTLLVRELQARGRRVRVLSRKPRPGGSENASADEPEWFVGDLLTGIGVPAAVDGVGTIVHCATGTKGDAKMGAQLMIAATRASRPHVVFPSMVGCEVIRSDQYRDKRAVERMLESGELPWTVLRCTHFHEHLEAELAHTARLPLMLVSAATRFQPIAAAEVAERLADLSSGIQSHRVPDLGGPEILTAVELAATWLAETGRVRKMVEVNKRGKQYEGWRQGAHLAPERAVGEQTFAAYLAATRRFREAETVAFEAAREQQKATDRELAKAAKQAEKAARKTERDQTHEFPSSGPDHLGRAILPPPATIEPGQQSTGRAQGDQAVLPPQGGSPMLPPDDRAGRPGKPGDVSTA
ncbi:MAG TPA: SDR family oxidoreductase [Sporichthyaceae bacterium]|jgi:uncharacterized protein YbjT (DUF2867 family)|nr:SDR family oxidoreductase [Sporichthyaceae bacterium]